MSPFMHEFIWEANKLPKPSNGVNRLCRLMNSYANLPIPFNKASLIFKKIIKYKLSQKNIEFSTGMSCLFGNLKGGYVDLCDAKILDYAPIIFGDGVFIGPNCQLITSWHNENNINEVHAKSIVIGNNVWLTMNVIVLAGVEIGSNTIIGAGSIVTKSIPENVIAAGNPARIIRPKIIQ